ncbi:MAG: PRC-barrel domain-containing protein [Phycisphaeraceae bacterium]
MPVAQLAAASTLLHRTIRNRRGELLGRVADLVMDVPHGSIAYALVAGHGPCREPDKLFVIPWSSFTIPAGEDSTFILDLEPEVFEHGPGLSAETSLAAAG